MIEKSEISKAASALAALSRAKKTPAQARAARANGAMSDVSPAVYRARGAKLPVAILARCGRRDWVVTFHARKGSPALRSEIEPKRADLVVFLEGQGYRRVAR
jgi:hypothetical protein